MPVLRDVVRHILPPQALARYNASHYADAEYLGRGEYRAVYGYDAYSVVKMATNDWNIGQNRAEVITWTKRISRSPDEPYFARILEWTEDYTWVRAERIVRTAADYFGLTENNKQDFWEDLMIILATDPEVWHVVEIMKDYNMVDHHPWNIGQRADGSWCCLDYAL